MTSEQNTIIVNELPLIQTCPNFLSKDECNELIEYSKGKLEQGEVVDGITGESVVNVDYRSAFTCALSKSSEISKTIFNKVEKFTNISSLQYEIASITHYAVGQQFKLHPDYLNPRDTHDSKSILQYGGNRIGTIIIYLNEVEKGGETLFPWIGQFIIPKTGKLVHFKYNYSNAELNIRTEHASMPVLEGEKYILTIWFREQPVSNIVEHPLTFVAEEAIRTNLVDTKFEIKCGIAEDQQILSVELPANNDPANVILVPFTGGMDSSLLLYLIGALNNQQSIPYHIRPICIYLIEADGTHSNLEDYQGVIDMYELIKNKIGGNISSLMFEPGRSIRHGILSYKDDNNPRHTKTHKFLNRMYVYSAENAIPNEDDPRWKNVGWSRTKSTIDFWRQPFFNLQKYHIVDAMLQLGLTDIIEHTRKCQHNHPTLDHVCKYMLCNERRWAFTKLQREEIGNKYFINKGTQ